MSTPQLERIDPLDFRYLRFLDIETTGLHHRRGDRVTEIAICHRWGLQLSWKQSSSQPIGVVIHQLRPILERHIIIGHNLGFDLRFLSIEAARTGTFLPRMLYIDTISLVRRHLSSYTGDLKLASIARNLGLPVEDYSIHTARGDSYLTRDIYTRIVQQASIQTLKAAGLRQLIWLTV